MVGSRSTTTLSTAPRFVRIWLIWVWLSLSSRLRLVETVPRLVTASSTIWVSALKVWEMATRLLSTVVISWSRLDTVAATVLTLPTRRPMAASWLATLAVTVARLSRVWERFCSLPSRAPDTASMNWLTSAGLRAVMIGPSSLNSSPMSTTDVVSAMWSPLRSTVGTASPGAGGLRYK